MAAFLDGCRFNPAAGGTADWTYMSAVNGYQSPAGANVINGRLYKYRAESADLSQWEFGEGAYNTTTGVLARTTVLYNSSGTTSKINFSSVPQVAIVALKEDLISVEEANGFTTTQQAQARSNIGMSTEIGKIEFWPTTIVQPGRLKANGQSVSRTTYAALFSYLVRSGNCTFTSGSSTVNMPAHNLSVGDPVKLFTTGSLPTNFTAGTHGLATVGANYAVTSVVDANNVTLSAVAGGSAIVAASAGSGTQTWVNAPYGDGDGSTTFTVPNLNGTFPRAWDNGAGIDLNRTIGSLQQDAFQGHYHQFSDTVNSYLWVRGSSGVFPLGTGAIDFDRSPLSVGGSITDGSSGTPRVASETRPVNVALMATIRYSA
jgi:hypothetical protein